MIEGRRDLSPVDASNETWFTTALQGEGFSAFEYDGMLRLAHPHTSEYADEPIAVVTIVFDFTDGATEAAQFATRHLDDVEVGINSADGKLHFQYGESQAEADAFAATAPLHARGDK